MIENDPVMRHWRKWKHIGEEEPGNGYYDDENDPDWMKTDGAGWAIGRRIYDKSEIEVRIKGSHFFKGE